MVSSLTYPQKQDGSLCISLDPCDLNKAIIQEHYKAPTLDEITLSSFLTTFNTHKGCYQFLYMPFSLKVSQLVFQIQMDQITNRLPGIIAIHDDICVYGKDTTEHDKNLLKLMQTAQDHGLVFNSNKCSIWQPQISFYGAIFTV